MLTEPTRYRQRLPEVDALEVTHDTTDAVVAWLASWGRDAYVELTTLRVVEGADGTIGFPVPFGHFLVRDVRTGRWAPVPPGQLDAEYVSARADDRARRRG